MDAPKPIDAAPDAPVADRTWDEGGGTTLEYQLLNGATPVIQQRATAYYWKSLTPTKYPFLPNPGCAKTGMATPTDDSDDYFPWGMGTGTPPQHVYQDVGTPIVSGGSNIWVLPVPMSHCSVTTTQTCAIGSGTTTCPTGETCVPFVDGESRKHDAPFVHFVADKASGNGFIDKFDALYSLDFTGSSTWPAQAYPDAFYMPPMYTVTSPPFPTATPIPLVADTDFVETWTPPATPMNLPTGASINYVTGFIVPGIGPVVACIQDASVGSLTVPKDMVNYIRSLGVNGVFGRAIFVHRIQEFTDGTTHNHKRQDFVTKWCYVTPWTAP